MSKVILLMLLVTFVMLGLQGCATTENESSIPWNRPQSWEKGGPGLRY